MVRTFVVAMLGGHGDGSHICCCYARRPWGWFAHLKNLFYQGRRFFISKDCGEHCNCKNVVLCSVHALTYQ